MAFTVKRDNDPFKKYWWVILVGFGLIGAWICIPIMEPGTGSVSATRGEEGLKSGPQSLDAMTNPSGAPGGAVDLSMDGTGAYKKKSSDGQMTSSLYQAPAEAAAPGAPVTAKTAMSASADNLANALKDVAKKAKAANGGWGDAKVQKAFNAPKGNFGSLSGVGSSGGSSGASFSASAGAFGTSNANPGVTATRGLGAGGPDKPGDSGPKGMAALKNAQANALAAAGAKSADLASALGGKTFDGNGGSGTLASNDGKGGVYGALDSAAVPDNLKGTADDKKPDTQDATAVPKDPSKDQKDAVDQQAELRNKIMEIVVTGLVTGMTNAMVGSIFGAGYQAAAMANCNTAGMAMGTPCQTTKQ